ncbi:hypothetical protein ACROYT_G024635 [Oculina patagonica]
MSSVVAAVFRATIGLLVNKGRDKAAEKLKDGDVTDQKFRGLIVREIDEIKEKLNGLSRKDLLASVSFFKEGIELLYEVFRKARSRTDYGTVTAQAACAEAFSLAETVKNLELTGLDESAKRALSKAKLRFEDARRKATEAFNNEALEASDRILAMQYRVMATILETVDNPEDAVAPCRVCIEELNSYSAVQNSFDVQLKKGIGAVRGLFGKDERGKIISSVCQVNRVIYDVTQTVGKDVHLVIWPTIDASEDREDKVDPLRDERITEVLHKQGMEHCCVTWSFGQEGDEEHKLKEPWGIATNSRGQFIVGDRGDGNVKVFDGNGTFMKLISLPNDDTDAKLYVVDVATDMKDNIHVLAELKKPGAERSESVVYDFNNTADLQRKFTLTEDFSHRGKLKVTNSEFGLHMVLDLGWTKVADIRKTDDGQFVCVFGDDLKRVGWFRWDLAAANDGRVAAVGGEHVVVVGRVEWDDPFAFHLPRQKQRKDRLQVKIYTKDGEFVHSTQIQDKRIGFLRNGMTVTSEGRIAVAVEGKVLVL